MYHAFPPWCKHETTVLGSWGVPVPQNLVIFVKSLITLVLAKGSAPPDSLANYTLVPRFTAIIRPCSVL